MQLKHAIKFPPLFVWNFRARLFMKKKGNINDGSVQVSNFKIPILGSVLSTTDNTTEYALYDMLGQYPGYDVVLFPQYEKKVFNQFWVSASLPK